MVANTTPFDVSDVVPTERGSQSGEASSSCSNCRQMHADIQATVSTLNDKIDRISNRLERIEDLMISHFRTSQTTESTTTTAETNFIGGQPLRNGNVAAVGSRQINPKKKRVLFNGSSETPSPSSGAAAVLTTSNFEQQLIAAVASNHAIAARNITNTDNQKRQKLRLLSGQNDKNCQNFFSSSSIDDSSQQQQEPSAIAAALGDDCSDSSTAATTRCPTNITAATTSDLTGNISSLIRSESIRQISSNVAVMVSSQNPLSLLYSQGSNFKDDQQQQTEQNSTIVAAFDRPSSIGRKDSTAIANSICSSPASSVDQRLELTLESVAASPGTQQQREKSVVLPLSGSRKRKPTRCTKVQTPDSIECCSSSSVQNEPALTSAAVSFEKRQQGSGSFDNNADESNNNGIIVSTTAEQTVAAACSSTTDVIASLLGSYSIFMQQQQQQKEIASAAAITPLSSEGLLMSPTSPTDRSENNNQIGAGNTRYQSQTLQIANNNNNNADSKASGNNTLTIRGCSREPITPTHNRQQLSIEEQQQQQRDELSDGGSVGVEEDDQQPNELSPTMPRCNNCNTSKTTAWRRDQDGKLVCNACGLYFRLHRTNRPVHMRKDFIQQRFRRKNPLKEEDGYQLDNNASSPTAQSSSSDYCTSTAPGELKNSTGRGCGVAQPSNPNDDDDDDSDTGGAPNNAVATKVIIKSENGDAEHIINLANLPDLVLQHQFLNGIIEQSLQ